MTAEAEKPFKDGKFIIECMMQNASVASGLLEKKD